MTADLSKDALGKRYTFRMLLETLWGGHNPAPACFGIAREVWLSEADRIDALRAENVEMQRQVSFWGEGWVHLEARATAAEAALVAAMAGAVRVRPGVAERAVWSAMVWAAENSAGWRDAHEYTDGGNSFAEDEARATVRRILAALEPNPAAQDREALVAATLADTAQRADDAADQYERQGNAHAALALRLQATGIRSLATPAQTDALAAVRREARAEGMRKAAELIITHEMGTEMHSPPQLLTEAHDRILAAAEKEARHG